MMVGIGEQGMNNFVQNIVKPVENKKWGAREERGDVFEGQITGDSYRKIVTGMQYGLKTVDVEERCSPMLIERRERKHSPACTADAPPRTWDTSTQKVSKNTFDLRRGMKYSME